MDTIHLIGAEDVRKAGSLMQGAASDMIRAASSIEESLSRQRMFLEEWITRLEQIVDASVLLKILEKLEEIRCGIIDVENELINGRYQ